MTSDDEALGKMLLERGLLALEEYDEAVAAAKATSRPLAGILVEKSYLSPMQLRDAIGALKKEVRFCPRCSTLVYVTRVTAEGEKCPRCLGNVEWQAEVVVARIQDLQNIVQLTKDELPPEVLAARTVPGKLFGKYILVEELGRGGAGIVHKAWDTMLGEYVALKLIREDPKGGLSNPETKRIKQEQVLDFLQEARAALRLRHPHIVAMRDIGRIDQQFYIAMDYIDGDTLAAHFHPAQKRGRLSPLYEDPISYLGILRDVAGAIHHAHTFPRPIVHCDLKPGNIMVGRSGMAYVMDFGLAQVVGKGREEEEEARVRGTPAYMAPEQHSGKANAIGPWTDVWALGAILYEFLTGRAVFTGEPFEILFKARSGEAPDRPTDVIRKTAEASRHESTRIMNKISRLEAICLRCLAPEPEKRYVSAHQLALDLDMVIQAMESGQEAGMVPKQVVEAQERIELHRVDALMTQLDAEAALKEWENLKAKRDHTRIRHRLEDRRQQLLLVEELGKRLAERLNLKRPTMAKLGLAQGCLSEVEILKATTKKLYLLSNDTPREVAWSNLPPSEIVTLAEAVELTEPEDRLALGIVCHHARLAEAATRYLLSLRGTPFEEAAQHILQTSV